MTVQTPHAANAARHLDRIDASPVQLRAGRVCRRRYGAGSQPVLERADRGIPDVSDDDV